MCVQQVQLQRKSDVKKKRDESSTTGTFFFADKRRLFLFAALQQQTDLLICTTCLTSRSPIRCCIEWTSERKGLPRFASYPTWKDDPTEFIQPVPEVWIHISFFVCECYKVKANIALSKLLRNTLNKQTQRKKAQFRSERAREMVPESAYPNPFHSGTPMGARSPHGFISRRVLQRSRDRIVAQCASHVYCFSNLR